MQLNHDHTIYVRGNETPHKNPMPLDITPGESPRGRRPPPPTGTLGNVLNVGRTKRYIVLLGLSVAVALAWNVSVINRLNPQRAVNETVADPGVQELPGWMREPRRRGSVGPGDDDSAESATSLICGPNATADLHWCVCLEGFRVGQLAQSLQAAPRPASSLPGHNRTRSCTDSAAHLDQETGETVEPCSDWRSKNCYGEPGFSDAEMASVRRNCPLACGLCTPNHWTQISEAMTNDLARHYACPYATEDSLRFFGTTDLAYSTSAARRGAAPATQTLSQTLSASLHRKQERQNFLAIHNDRCSCQPATPGGAVGAAVPQAEMPVDDRSLLLVVPGMASAKRVAVVERNVELIRRGLGATVIKNCLVFTHKVRTAAGLEPILSLQLSSPATLVLFAVCLCL